MTVAIVSMERGKCYCLQKGTLGRRRRRGEIFFHTCVTSAGAFVLPPSPTTLRHPIWPSRPLQQRKREKELRGTQPHSRLLFFSFFFFFFFFIIYFPVFSFFSVRTRRPPSTARPPVSSALCDRLVVEEKKKKKSGGRKKRLFELDDSRRRRS